MLRFLAFVGMVLLTLVAASCGGSNDRSATATTTTDTATVDETTSETITETYTEPSESLGDFYTRRIDYEFKGQFGRSWDSLHPGQQALVPRTRYEECRDEASAEIAGVELESLEVIETYEDAIDVTGIPVKSSTAVTVEITVTGGSQTETLTDTFHAIPVNGEWAWVLPSADVRAFEAGTCPP